MKKQNGQEITRVSENKFHLIWHGVRDSDIVVDFNPIIKAHNLTGKYILLHWQARPKNLRTWGIYDSISKMYYSVGSDEIKIPLCEVEIIDIPEVKFKTVPTACILFRDVSWVDGHLQ